MIPEEAYDDISDNEPSRHETPEQSITDVRDTVRYKIGTVYKDSHKAVSNDETNKLLDNSIDNININTIHNDQHLTLPEITCVGNVTGNGGELNGNIVNILDDNGNTSQYEQSLTNTITNELHDALTVSMLHEDNKLMSQSEVNTVLLKVFKDTSEDIDDKMFDTDIDNLPDSTIERNIITKLTAATITDKISPGRSENNTRSEVTSGTPPGDTLPTIAVEEGDAIYDEHTSIVDDELNCRVTNGIVINMEQTTDQHTLPDEVGNNNAVPSLHDQSNTNITIETYDVDGTVKENTITSNVDVTSDKDETISATTNDGQDDGTNISITYSNLEDTPTAANILNAYDQRDMYSEDEQSSNRDDSEHSTHKYSYTSISSGHTTEQSYASEDSGRNSDDESKHENISDAEGNVKYIECMEPERIVLTAARDEHRLLAGSDAAITKSMTESDGYATSGLDNMSSMIDTGIVREHDGVFKSSETITSDTASYESDFDSDSESSANLSSPNEDAYEADFEQQSVNSSSEHGPPLGNDDEHSDKDSSHTSEHTQSELVNTTSQNSGNIIRERKARRLSYKQRNRHRDDMETPSVLSDTISEDSLNSSSPSRMRRSEKDEYNQMQRSSARSHTLSDVVDNASQVSSSRRNMPLSDASKSSRDSKFSNYSHAVSSCGTTTDIQLTSTKQRTSMPGRYRPPNMIITSMSQVTQSEKCPISAPYNESHKTGQGNIVNHADRPPSGRTVTSITSAEYVSQTEPTISGAVKHHARHTSETSLLSKRNNISIGTSVTQQTLKTSPKLKILTRSNSGNSQRSKRSTTSSSSSHQNTTITNMMGPRSRGDSFGGKDNFLTAEALKVHIAIDDILLSSGEKTNAKTETKNSRRKNKKYKRPSSGNTISNIRKLSTASLPPIPIKETKHLVNSNYENIFNPNKPHGSMLQNGKSDTKGKEKPIVGKRQIEIKQQSSSTLLITECPRRPTSRRGDNTNDLDNYTIHSANSSDNEPNIAIATVSDTMDSQDAYINGNVSESTLSINSAERRTNNINAIMPDFEDTERNIIGLNENAHVCSSHESTKGLEETDKQIVISNIANITTCSTTLESLTECKSEMKSSDGSDSVVKLNNDNLPTVINPENNMAYMDCQKSKRPKGGISSIIDTNTGRTYDENLIYEDRYLVSSIHPDNEQEITDELTDADVFPDHESIQTHGGTSDNKPIKTGSDCMSDIENKSNETVTLEAVDIINSNKTTNENTNTNTSATRSRCFRSVPELTQTRPRCNNHISNRRCLKKSHTFHNLHSKKKKESPVRINIKNIHIPTQGRHIATNENINTSEESTILATDTCENGIIPHSDDNLSIKSHTSSIWLDDNEPRGDMILRSRSAIEGSRHGKKLFADMKRPSELADLARLQDIRREFDLREHSTKLDSEKSKCTDENQGVVQPAVMRNDALDKVSGILHDLIMNVCRLGNAGSASASHERYTITDESGKEQLCCIIQNQSNNMCDVTCDVINPLEVAPVVQSHEILLSYIVRLSPQSLVHEHKWIDVAVPIDETCVAPWQVVTARSLDNSGNWVDLAKCERTKIEENGQTLSLAEIHLCSLDIFAVVARPMRDVVTVGTSDVTVTSSIDGRVRMDIPGKKLSSERQIIVQVIPIDTKTLASYEATKKQCGADEDTTIIGTSPLVVVNVSGPSSDAILFTVPCVSSKPRPGYQQEPMTSYLQVTGVHVASPYLRQRAMESKSHSPCSLPRSQVNTPDSGAGGDYQLVQLADRSAIKIQRLADNQRREGDPDFLSFPICNRDTRFIVMETKRAMGNTELESLAKSFSKFITQNMVTIRIIQDNADASLAHMSFSCAEIAPRKERFQFNHYNKHEVKLLFHEGETICMNFRGNVKPIDKIPVVYSYHTCHGITKTFQLNVIDHFGQRSLASYHGKVQIYTMKDRRLAAMDDMTSPVMTSGWELRAELPVILPKLKPTPPALVQKAPIALKFEEPLSTDFLKVISAELVKDWIKFATALKVSNARIQAIRQHHRNVVSADVIMDIILCWMKRQPVSADKVRPMVRALRACRKWRLIAELTARQKAVLMYRSQSTTVTDDKLKDAIALVCKSHIATERWRHIYHQLCSRILGSDVIDDIKDIDRKYESEATKCYNALCMWRESTNAPSLWKLIDALRISNCTGVADTVIVRSSTSK